jgi:hypothetical protein
MSQPLELEDITGLSLTLIGTLVESYVKDGYADPLMYKALRAGSELAQQFMARLLENGVDNTELLEGVSELITNLQVTAMECGEVVNRIIEDNGLPISKDEWSEPHDCDHDHADGEGGE